MGPTVQIITITYEECAFGHTHALTLAPAFLTPQAPIQTQGSMDIRPGQTLTVIPSLRGPSE